MTESLFQVRVPKLVECLTSPMFTIGRTQPESRDVGFPKLVRLCGRINPAKTDP